VTSKGNTVLVVDDESAIRTLIVRILTMQGYEALEAANGLEALQLFGSYRSHIVLVITDVQMPVMGGLEAAERIRSMSPEMPVIVMTGAAGDQGQRLAAWQPMRKPFSPADLLARVRAATKEDA
jgi:CheY-like chemotaxis protein